MSKIGYVCIFGAIGALWAGVLICDKNIKMIHEKQNEIIDEVSKLQDHAKAATKVMDYMYQLAEAQAELQN